MSLPSFTSSLARRGLAGLLLFLAAVARAADTPAPVIASSPLNMVWGIVFLLALVLAAWWLVRRAGGLQMHGGRGMKVIAALPLGPRERVVLVEIAGQQWLLGVTPGSVNLLHRFDEPIMKGGGSDDFANRIRAVLQQGVGK